MSGTGQVLSTRSTAEEMFFHADAGIPGAHCVCSRALMCSICLD